MKILLLFGIVCTAIATAAYVMLGGSPVVRFSAVGVFGAAAALTFLVYLTLRRKSKPERSNWDWKR